MYIQEGEISRKYKVLITVRAAAYTATKALRTDPYSALAIQGIQPRHSYSSS